MKNTLGDLNNHLFAALERLNDEDMDKDTLSAEIERARALTGIASQIIANGNLVLKAKVAADENMRGTAEMPKMLEG